MIDCCISTKLIGKFSAPNVDYILPSCLLLQWTSRTQAFYNSLFVDFTRLGNELSSDICDVISVRKFKQGPLTSTNYNRVVVLTKVDLHIKYEV